MLFGSNLGALLAEIHVTLCLKGDEVDVGVRHLHAKHGNTYPLAGNGGLDGHGHLAGKGPQTCIHILIQMEDIIVFNVLGDDQGVSGSERVYVKERVVMLVLGNLP